MRSSEFSPFVEIVRVADQITLSFWYDLGQFRICVPDEKVEIHCEQIALFDYLNELKIDYRGLIDAGLAVDCNTLENNPYK